MSIKVDTTNDENGVGALRDGFFLNAKARRGKDPWGAAPISDEARAPGAKHPFSPEGGGT